MKLDVVPYLYSMLTTNIPHIERDRKRDRESIYIILIKVFWILVLKGK